jgi:ankyrin repeat protein
MSHRAEDPPLIEAVQRNDLPKVRELLAAGADPNLRGGLGDTPLHHARSLEVTRVLLEHGADVNARGFLEATPIHSQIGYRRTQSLRLLLAHGADVNARDLNGETPLMGAAADAAALLIASGAEINVGLENRGTKRRDLITASGATALHFAARLQDAATIAVLLAHGAEVNAEDGDGCSPLDWAEMARTETMSGQVAGLLEAYGGKRGATCMGRFLSGAVQPTAENLWYAVHKGHLPSVLALLRDPTLLAEHGARALYEAAGEGRLQMLRAVLAAGADPNRVVEGFSTPLGFAGYQGYPLIVRELLDAGADPNLGKALFLATFRGHLTVVRQLLAAGADPNPDTRILDGIQVDPSESEWYDHPSVSTLLDAAVAPNEGEWHGHPGIVRALVEAGTRFTDRTGRTLEEAMRRCMVTVEPFLREPFADDLNERDDDGVTALMWASELSCTESVRKLLALGADPALVDPFGRNALDRSERDCPEVTGLLREAMHQARFGVMPAEDET